ncbi:MAG: ABC transporter ATP-binding protein [Synergistaceae bacterium]|nr:ABC transporter ATP-binding protein [Synergistaceae bacterium]
MDAKEQNMPGLNRRMRFAEVEKAENIWATLKRIATYFVKEKIILVSMFSAVIIGTTCGIYAPALQSKAIDIIAGEGTGNFFATLSLMIIIYMIYSAGQLFQSLLGAKLSQKIVRRMRRELFNKIISLPVSYLDIHPHGDVMSRMTNDIENISMTVSQSLPSLFSGALTIVGTTSVMLFYCWQLTLLSCVSILLTLLATKILSRKVREFSRQRQKILGELNSITEEMISGYRTVVAYNHQEITIKNFCETANSLTKAGIKADIFGGIMGPVMNCIGNVGFVMIAVFGGYFAAEGIISVGTIAAFIVYAKQFSRPINEIAQVYGQLQTAIAGGERVFAILDEADESNAGDDLIESEKNNISFRHVNFSYNKSDPTIRDFNLEIPSGKKIALVGATGSGKTTIVNLLMRFYDIDNGEIFINSQEIKTISRSSLRKNIAIVLQDTILFSDTVLNNLKYANENAADEQIQNALKISRCDDIALTETGDTISQGQRQLIAIARTFIADPKILIFDEATANIDTRTEKLIQDAMQSIMKNRTSIIIAHRLSTIRDADIIVVMDQGSCVEIGSHGDLLAKKGRYYELYTTQYRGLAT